MEMELRLFHLPFMIIIILIGYQLSIYFFYLYFKLKHEKLRSNQILIVYGWFFGLLITGYLFRLINRYYITNQIINEIITRLAYSCIILSLIISLLYVSSKNFKDFFNPKITKALILINLIPLTGTFILPMHSIEFYLTLGILAISLLIMLYYQIKLIKTSAPKIKKKFFLILLGAIIILFAVILGGEGMNLIFFQREQQELELSIIIGSALGVVGFTFIFIGAYNFPALLEFDWRKHLLRFYVINQKERIIMYSVNFTQDLNKFSKHNNYINESDKLHSISKSIFGIEEIISKITDSQDQKLKRIHQAELTIIIDYGEGNFEYLAYFLVVKKESPSFDYLLYKLKNIFQTYYKNILKNIDIFHGLEMDFFSSFDEQIKQIFEYH
ncbi:MAG: hypothetical protein ACTSR8_17830 [Promethearchaeota archaeon]